MITRPEPDASQLAERLQRLGHQTIIEPLLQIKYLNRQLALDNVQAIIFTSRNAVRWVQQMSENKKIYQIPAISVGPATSAMAKQLGFSSIFEGEGTVETLIPLISRHFDPKNGKLLHISGEDIASDISPKLGELGFEFERHIAYQTIPAKTLSDSLCEVIKQKQLDGVILLSPKTAHIWAGLLNQSDEIDDISEVKAYCLSSAVAEPLKNLKNVQKKIAKKPNIEELLSLINEYI